MRIPLLGFPGGLVASPTRPEAGLAFPSKGPYCQVMDLKSGIEYVLFRVLAQTLRSLPAEAGESALEGLGRFSRLMLRKRRRIVTTQLQEVFPQMSECDRQRLAAEVFAHLGRTVGEVFGRRVDRLADRTRVVPGWDRVDEALQGGNGAIIATGHIGNFELGGVLIARRYPLLDVVKTQRNRIFDDYIQGMRHYRGIETVTMERPGRAVLRHLRSGGLVSLLVDQDAGASGAKVDFLGRPASTWTGAARFSIRTGCPIIPVAMCRVGPGQHELQIAPPLVPSDLEDCPQDVIAYTSRISDSIGDFIRQHPEQWFWVHRRWKGAAQGREG